MQTYNQTKVSKNQKRERLLWLKRLDNIARKLDLPYKLLTSLGLAQVIGRFLLHPWSPVAYLLNHRLLENQAFIKRRIALVINYLYAHHFKAFMAYMYSWIDDYASSKPSHPELVEYVDNALTSLNMPEEMRPTILASYHRLETGFALLSDQPVIASHFQDDLANTLSVSMIMQWVEVIQFLCVLGSFFLLSETVLTRITRELTYRSRLASLQQIKPTHHHEAEVHLAALRAYYFDYVILADRVFYASITLFFTFYLAQTLLSTLKPTLLLNHLEADWPLFRPILLGVSVVNVVRCFSAQHKRSDVMKLRLYGIENIFSPVSLAPTYTRNTSAFRAWLNEMLACGVSYIASYSTVAMNDYYYQAWLQQKRDAHYYVIQCKSVLNLPPKTVCGAVKNVLNARNIAYLTQGRTAILLPDSVALVFSQLDALRADLLAAVEAESSMLALSKQLQPLSSPHCHTEVIFNKDDPDRPFMKQLELQFNALQADKAVIVRYFPQATFYASRHAHLYAKLYLSQPLPARQLSALKRLIKAFEQRLNQGVNISLPLYLADSPAQKRLSCRLTKIKPYRQSQAKRASCQATQETVHKKALSIQWASATYFFGQSNKSVVTPITRGAKIPRTQFTMFACTPYMFPDKNHFRAYKSLITDDPKLLRSGKSKAEKGLKYTTIIQRLQSKKRCENYYLSAKIPGTNVRVLARRELAKTGEQLYVFERVVCTH